MEYRFDDFNWLGDASGFNVPTDVFYGTVLLGVLISKPSGYIIQRVSTPKGVLPVTQTKNNNFKTKDDATKALHYVWKSQRTI